jgi:geranylgeranyl diphosphate synthase type II
MDDMFTLNAYLDEKRRLVNAAIDQFFNLKPPVNRVVEAMQYSLSAGGKRLRPILLLSAAEAVGGECTPEVVRAACALEMIHTYSLIHDDLPAMDNDRLRRGKPTCHIQYDEATAILAGDALLTLAFEILSCPENMETCGIANHLKVIRIISEAAGYKGMVGGQMLDMIIQGKFITTEKLKEMHSMKTGALIRASVVSGAVLGGGSEARIEALDLFGQFIGIAFQVIDDILDVEGDPKLMGKAAGCDAAKNKNTYPALMGLDLSRQFAAELVQNALQALRDFDRHAIPLREIANYVINRKK